MEKVLKHIHWLIIAYGLYNAFELYTSTEERLVSLNQTLPPKKAELKKNEKSLKEIADYYKNINEEKAKIEKVAEEIEKMQQLLPSDTTDSENIDLIKKMAEDVNIKELSITPEQEKESDFLITRRYRVKGRGTYLQFLILLEKVSENKRIMNVRETVFTKTEEPQRGKYQVINAEFLMEAYRYNPHYKEDRGYDKIEADFKKGLIPPLPGAGAEAGEAQKGVVSPPQEGAQ